MKVGLLVMALVVLATGCGDALQGDTADTAAPVASTVPSLLEEEFVVPPSTSPDPNPLDLPPIAAPKGLEKGQRVFAVPPEMLRDLAPGHVVEMRAAYYRGEAEGGAMLVRVGFGPTYAIHPGYVVVPRRGRFGRGVRVIASYRGRLHHGVVSSLRRDRVVVQFTDLGFKLGEQRLDPKRIGKLGAGLEPGGFAVRSTEQGLAHVLLVSSGSHPDGKERWLTIGHLGIVDLVESEKLQPLPPKRLRLRKGDAVRAAWHGTMVPGTLREFDRPGLYTVKRPRSGAPLLVGPGMIMPATAP